MSGFAGYMLNQKSEIHEKERIDLIKMTETIKHRGPDGEGFYMDGYIRLGSRILNTMNLEHGYQPLSYENGRYWIVFDGAIYNYAELREQLKDKGYTFQGQSDAEVILVLYSLEREHALDDLRGMFSFLIWDKEKKELFGARDPFGIKPFYYIEKESGLYFASEMKSLLHHIKDDFNQEALQHYFSYQYVPEPQTMKTSVRKLEPGYFFHKKPGYAMCLKSFAQLHLTPKQSPLNRQTKAIESTLRDAVSLHMQSNAPVGAFLSGGVDSSSIVAFAKEVNPSIKTFTVGFERKGYSEIDIARETAEELNVANHHRVITAKEFVQALPNVIKYMDDPVADPASVPLYFAAEEASKQVGVILSGEGADELFGGYNIYREPSALKPFNLLPKTFQTMLQALANKVPEGVRGKSFIERGTTPLEDRFIGNANLLSESEKTLLLKNYQYAYHYKNITMPLYNRIRHYPDVHKMQYIDLYTWARGDILVKADRMTMAHSLELRTPFFDRKVFSIAAELRPEQTIAKGTTKYALREAMRGIVPKFVLYNKKLGFPVPIRHWLRNELSDWAKKIIKDSPTGHLINKSYVYSLLEKHQLKKSDYSRKIWAVLVFMIWYNQSFHA